MSNSGQKVVKVLAPLMVLVFAVGVAVVLVKSRSTPEKKAAPDMGLLVEAHKATASTRAINVKAQGEVMPSRTVVLTPRVLGEVTWISEKLVVGGLVEKGEPLVKIDRDDYVIAVEQSKTGVAQAEAQLKLEEGQQDVAKKEWELFSKEEDANSDPSLALRGPQKRIAEVNLSAAESRLKKANLDLKRTTIRAPFNAYVRTEMVEVGQFVGNQSQLATLVGTDQYWVQVSVPVDRIGLIDIPGMNSKTGAKAVVKKDIGSGTVERDGKVLRMLGDLDPVGRMARLIVEVDDPLNLKMPVEERGMPVLIGAYVDVLLAGGESADVVALPRRAIKEGNQVHVFDDGKLKISKVNVVWSDASEVLVRGGIEADALYITSNISSPVEGMKLRMDATREETDEKRAEVAP